MFNTKIKQTKKFRKIKRKKKLQINNLKKRKIFKIDIRNKNYGKYYWKRSQSYYKGSRGKKNIKIFNLKI